MKIMVTTDVSEYTCQPIRLLPFGSGLKGKPGGAMMNGLQVITTIGTKGIVRWSGKT
jgi:hypothetical protein